MFIKRIFAAVLVTVICSTTFSVAFAEGQEKVKRNFVPVELNDNEGEAQETCGFEVPEEKTYGAEVVAVRKKLKLESGEVFRVKIFLKNTGTMPWFSDESSCLGPKMFLGTDKVRDRASDLYTPYLEGVTKTNWVGTSRIRMDQSKVGSGEIASFTFWSEAPEGPDVIKEYFTPYLKDIEWVDDASFSLEFLIGDVDESPIDLRTKILYSVLSGSVLDINLYGEKMILVDLSDQTMQAYLDDKVIREFPVSTGAAKTPTPVGETQISLKQEVRVGHKAPHYIMPKFMMFRAGGYGMHALPSLGNDGGWFWTEARNHIGIPVSHGCIRLLPEDADFMYEFTPVGTKVVVQW